MSSRPLTRLTSLSAELLQNTEAFVFDCDGVIWRATELCSARIPAVIRKLRILGKQIFFVTNNSTKSRATYLEKFKKLNIEIFPQEMYSAGFAATEFIKQRCPDIMSGKRKIYMLGMKGLEEELKTIGLPEGHVIGGPNDAEFKAEMLKLNIEAQDTLKNINHDPDVGAVIVGFDASINYFKIQYAQLCLSEKYGRGKDCLFLATNPDAVAHMTPDQEWAGNAAMIGAIKGCTKREPTVIGKPSSLLIDLIVEKHGLDKRKMLMIGDRLDTDIQFGLENEMTTILVLSGVTEESELMECEMNKRPHYFMDTVGSFFGTEVEDVVGGAGA